MDILGFAGLVLIVFALLFVMLVLSVLLLVAEVIGIVRFSPWVYRLGIRVMRTEEALPPPPDAVSEPIEVPSGKIKLASNGLLYFHRRFYWLSVGLRTPFPIKGIIVWSESRATIEGRLPLFSSVALAIWTVVWTLSAIAQLAGGSPMRGIGLLALGWGLIAIFVLSVPVELRRARLVLEDIRQYLRSTEL